MKKTDAERQPLVATNRQNYSSTIGSLRFRSIRKKKKKKTKSLDQAIDIPKQVQGGLAGAGLRWRRGAIIRTL